MVGHVEGIESGLGIGLQRIGGALGIELAPVLLQVGDLPEPADQAADVQVVRKVDALWLGWHGWNPQLLSLFGRALRFASQRCADRNHTCFFGDQLIALPDGADANGQWRRAAGTRPA